VSDVLIYADSVRSPEMRHEVPVTISDPFLYAEHDGRRCVVTSELEVERIQGVGLDVIPYQELGLDELMRSGLSRDEILLELTLRGCRSIEIRSAAVPKTFPLDVADHLRAHGIELHVDRQLFESRRRAKTEAELAGIRRAQRAAEAGMEAARGLLRQAEERNGALVLDGAQLTCERLKVAVSEAFSEHDAAADEFTIAHGAQAAAGHDRGSGPISPGKSILIDLFPRDRESGCYADMTRTYVLGTPPADLREYHRLCLEALEAALSGTRPGVAGHDLFAEACRLFEQHGFSTQRSNEPPKKHQEGFFHALGHGVGLELHEKPTLSIVRDDPLAAGDVITIEPGLYRQGYGGCRLEDLVLVTESGAERLTDFPYDLEP
jgi:Xaa-Pro aminopeptidase